MKSEPLTDDLYALVSAAQRIFVCGGTGFPGRFIERLAARPELLAGKDLVCGLVPGFGHTLPRVVRGNASEGSVTVFFGANGLAEREEVSFVPMQYRRQYDYVANGEFDLCLARVVQSPEGDLHFGMGVDFQPAAFAASKHVLVEVHDSGRFVRDAPKLESGRITAQTVMGTPSCRKKSVTAVESGGAVRDPVGSAIGRNVASLVRDGDCLQTGIGAIPDAVLAALESKSDLGCHSGMIGDGIERLVRCGALTGSNKSIDRSKVVTGFVLGGRRLETWASNSDAVALRPVNYTHDPRVLASIDSLVCINSAIEVCLSGQVNAEMVGGRQISGTGGAVDFARGAGLSSGGRSIVAMPATARGGEQSRIVRGLQAGTCATLLRTDVDFVVTEFGVAELKGCSSKQRRRNLADVAAPQFRSKLL